ncbi:hypothetical protein OHA98_39335 [Streptomyces sp. NBC_00654]|uniref:hypothetical protein n=1 Tax=Streptomyces sp. NBC_00654 TaxID=2975799 RepID=UPI00224EEE2F|nr:hypothetical protein [Streptomyces sp. NBC_00654]MCX4970707.1 hypothetical protein [Streptomyces sp. NBC_00654]
MSRKRSPRVQPPGRGVRRLWLLPGPGEDEPFIDIREDGLGTLNVWVARDGRHDHFCFETTARHIAAAERSALRRWAVFAVLFGELAVFHPDAAPARPPGECRRVIDTILGGTDSEVERYLTMTNKRFLGGLRDSVALLCEADLTRSRDREAFEKRLWFGVESLIINDAERARRAQEAERRAAARAAAVRQAFEPYNDALLMPERDDVVQRAIGLLGSNPAISEFEVGAPAHHDRYLTFGSGGEIMLRDGEVTAILFHVQPTEAAPRGFAGLSTLIPGLSRDASRSQVEEALGAPIVGRTGPNATYPVGGGFVKVFYDTWAEKDAPGHLKLIQMTAEDTYAKTDPADERCPGCAGMLIRTASASGGVDVDATITALRDGIAAGHLRQAHNRVALNDMLRLHGSGLMEHVEAQLGCTICHRHIFFALHREADPTFEYVSLNDTCRRPPEQVPPVEQWGDAARIARKAQCPERIATDGNTWVLFAAGKHLFMNARCWYSAVEGSRLIRLKAAEVRQYEREGEAYLSRLQEAINRTWTSDDDPWRTCDLSRSGMSDEEAIEASLAAEQEEPA